MKEINRMLGLSIRRPTSDKYGQERPGRGGVLLNWHLKDAQETGRKGPMQEYFIQGEY